MWRNYCVHSRGLPRGLEILLSRRFFCTKQARKCLKLTFTLSLPNCTGCQIDLSSNNANFPIQFPFSNFEIFTIMPSRSPLGCFGAHNLTCVRYQGTIWVRLTNIHFNTSRSSPDKINHLKSIFSSATLN